MTASVARFIESFIPENYNLFLDINRSEKTFTGNVAITGEALDNHISLHQKDLTISSVLLDNESLNFQMDDANEAFHIELPETGVLTLVIEFSGRITDNMTGIYPSYYTYNGEKKEIISTQFESHFAREAFPSVDEPEAKATFDFSLKFDAEEGDIALSNMPEINSHLREHTSLPLVLELFKVRQRKHKTELKLVSSLQLHKLKTALTLPLILPFVSLISTKTTSKSSILSHCHTISHFLTSQQVPWKTGDLLPIVKFTFL